MLLNELNSLLSEHQVSLGLPSFRSEVSMSGNNLSWLKKTLSRNAKCPARLVELSSLPIQELVRVKK